MALQLNDEQLASFEALTGIDPGQLNDVTVAYLKSVSGSDSNDPQDLWYATLTGLGYTGAVQDMQVAYWTDILGHGGQWNDLYYEWLVTTGGAFGPNVAIVDDTPIPFCEYVEPVTECTASGPYTANDSGFTNPADTWLWTLEPPVAGIVLTNATLKTCTVETQDFATKQSFNLKVVATDSVSTDTATRTTAFLQRHIDATAAPVFIGPDINNVQFEINDPISAFDFTLVFTGTNLVYDTIGTWPTGLSLSSVGILTGTPTVEETVAGLQVRATNSKGNAVTNTFDVEITNLGYSLAVTEQAAGSCSWEVPQTGCTAQGTYIATPTDYVPDTWVWSFSTITQGTPTITAGQGTNTVTVDSTGPTTAIFTLKCVASNADPKSAQDLTQFTQVHTDDTVAIAFDGPNIGDQTFIVDELFTLDVSSLFSGTIETWALLGTWPTSFVISGAGVITGTAVIGDVGSFTGLSVRASNTLPDSADSDTFNADVTDVVLPAFYALTPDETTYEMLGVKIGTGGLTTTHTADLYAADVNNVYIKYAANDPVWSGGRIAQNAFGSWTNAVFNTSDMTTFVISDTNLGGVVVDATTLDMQNASGYCYFEAAKYIPTNRPNSITCVVRVTLLPGSTLAQAGLRCANAGVTQTVISVFPSAIVAPTVYTYSFIVPPGQLSIIKFGFETRAAEGGSGVDTGTINVTDFQLEFREDPADLIPSEYYHINNVNIFNTLPQKVYANLNGNTVLSNVVTEAVGAPLAEVPYLQYYPAAENRQRYSNDYSQVWTFEGNITATPVVGLTGEPATGNLVDRPDGTSGQSVVLSTLVTSGLVYTAVYYVLKTTSAATFPVLRQQVTGYGQYILNTDTGVLAFVAGGTVATAVDVVDTGLYWKVLIEATTTATSAFVGTQPASSIDGTTLSDTPGFCTIGNMEIYQASLAEVRGLGPIFTTTAAVATDATVYDFDIANHVNDNGVYYHDWKVSTQPLDNNSVSMVRLNNANESLFYSQLKTWLRSGDAAFNAAGNNGVGPLDIDVQVKQALVYDATDALFNVNRNGTYAVPDTTYSGTYQTNLNAIRLGPATASRGFTHGFREFQRYDITSLQNGKDIIDDLMAEVLVAEDDSELTTETNDSLTKG